MCSVFTFSMILEYSISTFPARFNQKSICTFHLIDKSEFSLMGFFVFYLLLALRSSYLKAPLAIRTIRFIFNIIAWRVNHIVSTPFSKLQSDQYLIFSRVIEYSNLIIKSFIIALSFIKNFFKASSADFSIHIRSTAEC